MIGTLQAEEIDDNWEWIEEFLNKVDQDEWTPEYVKEQLKESRAQLWVFAINHTLKGLWITTIERAGSDCHGLVWITAGESLEDGLTDFKNYIEPWFLSRGCRYIQINGRRGWKKVLKDYEEAGVILIKRLNHESQLQPSSYYHH